MLVLANQLPSCSALIQCSAKVLHDFERENYLWANNLVNKDPITNHYATLLILLSQDRQEGQKRETLSADKDFFLSFCFRLLRYGHGFQSLFYIMFKLCSLCFHQIKMRRKAGSPFYLHINLPCPLWALRYSSSALTWVPATKWGCWEDVYKHFCNNATELSFFETFNRCLWEDNVLKLWLKKSNITKKKF